MTIEAEQIDQLLETLRRDCLPSGGADLISAYVASQRQALAQVHAELAAKPANDLAKTCIERLIESGAENYLEHHFVFTIDGEDTARPATVTVQFKDRPSPHQLRLVAETELAGALRHLDAVVNGYGCDMHNKPGGPREFLDRHAQAEQQEAQGDGEIRP